MTTTNTRTTRVIIIEDKLDEQKKAVAAVKALLGDAVIIDISDTYVGFRDISDRLFIYRDDWKKYEDVFILTDMMFPIKTGGKEEPNGLLVLESCIFHGLPVAVCSDLCTGHSAGWLYPALEAMGKIHPLKAIPKQTESKDWTRCIESLVKLKEYRANEIGAASQG
jgi:hypothetical protein